MRTKSFLLAFLLVAGPPASALSQSRPVRIVLPAPSVWVAQASGRLAIHSVTNGILTGIFASNNPACGVAPIIGNLLYGFLLAMGYVAAFFVSVIQSLFRGGTFPTLRQFAPPLSDAEEAEALRQIEATRPFVVGAVEIVIGLVALIVVIILVDRMASERRQTLPEGATLDRETSAGEGIGAFLAGLLPRRPRRAAPPRDDGTPAGALRALYWRYLARGDATGIAWRAPGETPREHHERGLIAAPRNEAATVLVRAFEDLRYGDRDPDAATVEAARRGLAAIEAAR